MKRVDLLKQSLSEDKNVEVQLNKVSKEDKRFISRSKRDIQNEIEDLEIKLEDRLTSVEPLDKSTIEVVYASILAKQEQLSLYENFEKNYL